MDTSTGTPTVEPPLRQASQLEPLPQRKLAGFWRRLLALAIDSIITAIPCFVIGSLFFNSAPQLMWLAVWIGFAITFVYFAGMDSRWGEGATVGKRLMGIEVIDSEGKYLTRRAATVRYAALLGAFFLTDLVGTSLPILPTLASMLERVLFLGIIYFYVFGGSERQPLHDLLAHSYVVNDKLAGEVRVAALRSVHWRVFGALACAVAIFCVVPVKWYAKFGPYPELLAIQEEVVRSGASRSASVNSLTTYVNGTKSHGLVLTVPSPDSEEDRARVAANIAKVVYGKFPDQKEQDYLRVVFFEGFQVGFAQFKKQSVVVHPTSEWLEILNKIEANKA